MTTKPKASKIVKSGTVALLVDGKATVNLPDAPNDSASPEIWVTWALNRAEYNARRAAANETVRSLGESLAAMKASGRFATDAWERMFKDSSNPYKTHFPFTRRTGEKFVTIAKNPILFSRSHETALPASWTSLYELAALPAARLERAFERGLITADMERKDVKLLMPAKQQEPAPENPMDVWFEEIEALSQKLVDKLLEARTHWKKLTDGDVDKLRLILSMASTKLTELESRHA